MKISNGTENARITPACAGKSSLCSPATPATRDHPRVCGEKLAATSAAVETMGSPPRVRGKAGPAAAPCPALRITPACAGKRSVLPRLWCAVGDHPRVCGEKMIHWVTSLMPVGSPPRVRGKGPFALAWSRCYRITPACAGKRLKRSHSIGHFSCILCLFHSVLHRASVSGGSRAGPCAPPCLPAQNAVPV